MEVQQSVRQIHELLAKVKKEVPNFSIGGAPEPAVATGYQPNEGDDEDAMDDTADLDDDDFDKLGEHAEGIKKFAKSEDGKAALKQLLGMQRQKSKIIKNKNKPKTRSGG